MDALKEAIIAYNVKAPVKYLSSFEGLPGTGYNDETDNNAYRYKWNSETLSFPTPVKKLRFKVLETNTKAGNNGHQFFSIGEFRVLDASGHEVSLGAENFVTNAQESREGMLENICDKKQVHSSIPLGVQTHTKTISFRLNCRKKCLNSNSLSTAETAITFRRWWFFPMSQQPTNRLNLRRKLMLRQKRNALCNLQEWQSYRQWLEPDNQFHDLCSSVC